MSRAKFYKGYTRKILRVDLTAGTVETEGLKTGQLQKDIGGAGFSCPDALRGSETRD